MEEVDLNMPIYFDGLGVIDITCSIVMLFLRSSIEVTKVTIIGQTEVFGESKNIYTDVPAGTLVPYDDFMLF